MTGWQPIDTAPRETGRPLLLYPYPYLREVWKTEAPYPNDKLLIDVNDPALRGLIKFVKGPGNVITKYEVDKRLLWVLSPQQGKDLFNQVADMAINGVDETEAERATIEDFTGELAKFYQKFGMHPTGEEGQPGDAAEREAEREVVPGEEPEAPTALASLLEGHWESYSDVFEGYWDDTQWRSTGGVPCEPTHWMQMPSPPLTPVGQ